MKRLPLSLFALFSLALPGLAEAQDGPLKCALDGVAPPFAMPTMDGKTEGLTVDMVNEVSRRIGRDISIDAMAFAGLIPALQAGTYDFICAPVTATEERAKSMLLTEGVWGTDYVFVVPAGGDPVATLDALKGKTIAVNQGTVYDKWAREHAEENGWKVESYASTNDSALAVQARRADAALMADSTALSIAQKNKAVKVSGYRYETGLVFSYAFAPGNEALRSQVEDALECIKTDGTAAKLYEKWLGAAPQPGSATVTAQPGYGVPGFPNADATPHEAHCG